MAAIAAKICSGGKAALRRSWVAEEARRETRINRTRVSSGEQKQRTGEPRQNSRPTKLQLRAGEMGTLMLSFPETRMKTEQPHNRGPENSNGSGTSELRSGAIFADERGEAYNLLPLEEPVNLGLNGGGNSRTQRIPGFPASVYDPAEIGLVNANHLGKPVLPYPCFVDRQLQIWVNRSLVEFHF